MKTVPLSLSKNYVSGWGLWEAVREILQNAIDTGAYEVDLNRDAGTIRIVSKAGAIPTSALLLGNTTKADDVNAIGQFGEGFKLALLVLARDGYQCEIFNGPCYWVPKFEYSPVFDSECLAIDIYDGAPNPPDHVVFTISGLDEDDFNTVRGNYLMEGDVSKVFQSGTAYAFRHGDKEMSKLFVNGLFVTELKAYGEPFAYSYNFPPDMVDLDRDRSTVNSWDIQSQISNLLIRAGRIDIMVDLSKISAPDIEGYSSWKGSHYGASYGGDSGVTFNKVLSDRAVDALLAEHGETMYLINKTNRPKLLQFLQTLAAEQGRKVVLLTDAHFSMIDPKSPYVNLERMPVSEPNLTLDGLIDEVKGLKKHMRSIAYKTVLSRLQQLLYKSIVN